MDTSNLSTIAMKATTHDYSCQDGQKTSSLTSFTYGSSSKANDVKQPTVGAQDYSSDLLSVGAWAAKQQYPGTSVSPEEGALRSVTFSIRVLTRHSPDRSTTTPMYLP